MGNSHRRSGGGRSGVILMKRRATILTNAHVCPIASKIVVSSPMAAFPANLVGSDTQTDPAVIQIKGTIFPRWRKLGDSAHLKSATGGALVIALGLSVPPTVTQAS